MPGDRAWAVRDEVRGGIQGGKKLPGLMSCAARYLEEPGTGDAPAPEIELPSGDVLRASDPDAAKRIGEAIAHEISLWPLLPADALEHYRRVGAHARRRGRLEVLLFMKGIQKIVPYYGWLAGGAMMRKNVLK